MASSRDACQGLQLGEGRQDETGLELSLGLSLSSTDSSQKWKTSQIASAQSFPSVDLAGEPSAGATLNGHLLEKPKPLNKASGLNADLKMFLEGRLSDEEESMTLLDGSNSFGLQEKKEKPFVEGSHEKLDHQLDMAAIDAESKGNPFLFKELQGSSGFSTTPLQLVDVFKTPSKPGSPCSAEGTCHFEEDNAIQGQQKVQDALKKRKRLKEEGKHQKKSKEEHGERKTRA